MSEESSLCENCSAIDFEDIRAPSAGQLRRLSSGEDVIGPCPFKIDSNTKEWNLGTVETVRKSSPSCSLCRALIELIDETINRASPDHLTPDLICSVMVERHNVGFFTNEGSHLSPEVLEHLRGADPWFDLRHLGFRFRILGSELPGPDGRDPYECAHAAILPMDPASLRESQELFEDEALPDQKLVFCGRKSPPKVCLKTVRSWIEECASKHERCVPAHSTTGPSKQRYAVFSLPARTAGSTNACTPTSASVPSSDSSM